MSKDAKLTLTNLCSRIPPKERANKIMELLREGAKLSETGERKSTVIEHLIDFRDSRTLERLLKEPNIRKFVERHKYEFTGDNALSYASIRKSDKKIFELLLGLDIDPSEGRYENSVSLLLSENRSNCLNVHHLSVVKQMLDKGARLPDESNEWYEKNIPGDPYIDGPAQVEIYKKIWNLYHQYRVFDHLEAGNIAAADAHFERGRVLPDSGLEREGKNLLTAVLHVQAKTDTATIARDDFALKILAHHTKPLKLARAAIDTLGAENIPSRVVQAINALEAQERQSSPRHRVAAAFSTAFGCVAALFQPTPAGYTPLHEEQPHRTDSTITLHTPEQPTVGKVH